MFTEKLTLYIGRDPEAREDQQWHRMAKEKCRDQAGRFDLGCTEKRKIDSRVFCLEKYCVCYVHYGQCDSFSFPGTDIILLSLLSSLLLFIHLSPVKDSLGYWDDNW